MTKAALAVMILGFCIVGRSALLWPIDTWPMYARFTAQFPGPLATEWELRAITREGRSLRLAPTDLLPYERVSALPRIVSAAFVELESPTREATRAWLTGVVERATRGATLERIEFWKVSWEVDALALPSLDVEAPLREIRQGSYRVPSVPGSEAP